MNKVFVFTGASGSGRKTIAHRLGRELGLLHIVSYTTRPMRPTDEQGREYHHVDRAAFIEADRNGEFLQVAEIGDHLYGIKRKDVEDALATGRHVYMLLNRYGANKVKFEYGDRAVRLFLYVDKPTLQARLEAKGLPFEVVESYLRRYTEEVLYRKECEFTIENRDLHETLERVKSILLEAGAPTAGK
ncbi:guanylate kinase [Paenibacillus thermoaerophilus]|uniref:Guanylate kinase n=1 Tax=Paenibacillus thermoaerophilus TaxID=1215385 RepID=A0ABW2V0S8_9BACL|nr:guanylate kinase [Paenibacillus thermoaerophilus]TMV15865.1 guanylate kinase [Paenibacillus thermoaerophilus]